MLPTLLKIQDLKPGIKYDMINNPHPNYLLYFVNEEGKLFSYDTVVKVEGVSSMTYNDVIHAKFFDPK